MIMMMMDQMRWPYESLDCLLFTTNRTNISLPDVQDGLSAEGEG